ncbi:MAG: hypothetical protein KIT59_00885 [Nitrosomonas sp.]|nr:hypothetical protein [Nitrosomonas sp.]
MINVLERSINLLKRLNMRPFEFDLDLQRGEEVIIRSAEVKGEVVDAAVNTQNNETFYRVIFEYGSVYVDGCGYETDEWWFERSQLRKIEQEEDKFHAWTINLEDVINRMLDRHKKIAEIMGKNK